MGAVLRWIGFAVLALLVTALGLLAWNVWGPPFTLRLLADRQVIALVADSPETLTAIGVIDGTPLDTHSGKLDPVTVERRDALLARAEKMKAELERYRDPARYAGQDRLTYAVLSRYYDDALALRPFEWAPAGAAFVYAVDQQWSQPTGFATFLQNLHQVRNAKLARGYVERLEAVSPKLDQLGAEVQRQADLGVILPAFLFDKTLKGMADLIAAAPEENAIYKDFATKLEALKGVDAQEKAALKARALAALTDGVYPAVQRLMATLEAVRPRATNDAGVWRLPDGPAFYAQMIRSQTTTDYTAAQIHALGLSEVARIEAEMDALLKAEGLAEGTVGARMQALSARPDQLFEESDAGREQVLAAYREMLTEIETRIVPQAFATVPDAKVEIRRMQPFEEVGAAGAYYMPPALDGSRPGVFFANLGDLKAVPRLSMKTLVVHEATPGHHFQIATAQGLSGLPLVRQVGNFTAYAEGWALYAERLAWELGYYENDRTGDLGRLRDEMFRAVRLVVDTGLHDQRWTREQAIAYMTEKTGMAAGEIENEIDRYITGPGQALAYKVGQLKILELREKARTALGDRFDLKAFHAVVLENGALPLTVLEGVVEEWIASSAAGS